ncbi:MAG: hypothetical protein ABIN97_13850 [Ginsengibacter sp.]
MYLKLIANNPYPQFDIYDEDKLAVRIKIDKEMQALRITCKDNRRVFFIAEEKFRKTSVSTLLNEYSQPLGALIPDKFVNNSGEIEIEGMKLNYRITNFPVKEIVLLENNKVDSVLNCRINDALLLEYSNYINYFIFALSWFAFLSKEKQEAMYFAEV